MSRPLICPIDHAAMLQGEDGVWRCRRQPGHTFTITAAGPAPTAGGTRHCPSNMACPLCEEEMIPVPGRPATWRCITNPGHILSLSPTMACAPVPEIIRDSPLIERARGLAPAHWLAHIGITGALLPPPQSNAGPGDYCQPLGDIAPGGGSKSGRRKKPPKKLKEDLWGV